MRDLQGGVHRRRVPARRVQPGRAQRRGSGPAGGADLPDARAQRLRDRVPLRCRNRPEGAAAHPRGPGRRGRDGGRERRPAGGRAGGHGVRTAVFHGRPVRPSGHPRHRSTALVFLRQPARDHRPAGVLHQGAGGRRDERIRRRPRQAGRCDADHRAVRPVLPAPAGPPDPDDRRRHRARADALDAGSHARCRPERSAGPCALRRERPGRAVLDRCAGGLFPRAAWRSPPSSAPWGAMPAGPARPAT